jgi:hypothetical protein
MNNLEFKSSNIVGYSHSAEGVCVNYNKNSFILEGLLVTELGVNLSGIDISNISKALINFNNSIRGRPEYEFLSEDVFEYGDLIPFNGPIYRYVKPCIFDKYIKKGDWQLGTVGQYRKIEDINRRDQHEGSFVLHLNINGLRFIQMVSAGFNCLILCCTDLKDSVWHYTSFGERKITIPDPSAFARAIARSIGARSWYIYKMLYTDLKTYVNQVPIYNNEINPERLLSDEYIKEIYQQSIIPSVFIKPNRFKVESEVRIVFEMSKNQKCPKRISNKGLNYLIDLK